MYNDISIKHNDYLVVQFDNRDFFTNIIELFTNSDFNKLIKINKEYCKNHKCDRCFRIATVVSRNDKKYCELCK